MVRPKYTFSPPFLFEYIIRSGRIWILSIPHSRSLKHTSNMNDDEYIFVLRLNFDFIYLSIYAHTVVFVPKERSSSSSILVSLKWQKNSIKIKYWSKVHIIESKTLLVLCIPNSKLREKWILKNSLSIIPPIIMKTQP